MKVEEFAIAKRTINALLKAGFKDLTDFDGKTKQEIKAIKGLGPNGYKELLEWLQIAGIKPKFRPNPKKVSPHSKAARAIVARFLASQNISWQLEIRIAVTLIEKWGEKAVISLIENHAPPEFYSLKYFAGFWVDRVIQQYLPIQIVEKKVEVKEVEEVKSEEYKPVEKGPVSFEQFLKIRK